MYSISQLEKPIVLFDLSLGELSVTGWVCNESNEGSIYFCCSFLGGLVCDIFRELTMHCSSQKNEAWLSLFHGSTRK